MSPEARKRSSSIDIPSRCLFFWDQRIIHIRAETITKEPECNLGSSIALIEVADRTMGEFYKLKSPASYHPVLQFGLNLCIVLVSLAPSGLAKVMTAIFQLSPSNVAERRYKFAYTIISSLNGDIEEQGCFELALFGSLDHDCCILRTSVCFCKRTQSLSSVFRAYYSEASGPRVSPAHGIDRKWDW